MWKRNLLLLISMFVTYCACSAEAQSRVPQWNARGIGPLPRQGIACLDVATDGTIVVGTIAPAGQPNVFALDSAGKLGAVTATQGAVQCSEQFSL